MSVLSQLQAGHQALYETGIIYHIQKTRVSYQIQMYYNSCAAQKYLVHISALHTLLVMFPQEYF